MQGDIIKRMGRFAVRLEQDPEPSNPCAEYDQAGTMVCWHSRYYLGHTGGRRQKHGEHSKEYAGMFPTPRDFQDWWGENGAGGVLLSLALLDHSGLHIWVGNRPHYSDAAGWDSGIVGYIFATAAKVQEEWDGDLEAAERCLRAEVACYDQYLTGDVWGWTVFECRDEDSDEVVSDHLDSCWGCYGRDYAKSEAVSALEVLAGAMKENGEWVMI